eukprot:COSAG06_NODE_6349_length_2973_cov_6.280445_3_plen_179_part_00
MHAGDTGSRQVVRGTPPSRQLVVRSSAISLLLPRDDKTEQYVASGVLIWLSDCTATCTGSRGAVEQSVSLKCLWVCSVECENALLRIRARARSHTHTPSTHTASHQHAGVPHTKRACRYIVHQTICSLHFNRHLLLSAQGQPCIPFPAYEYILSLPPATPLLRSSTSVYPLPSLLFSR